MMRTQELWWFFRYLGLLFALMGPAAGAVAEPAATLAPDYVKEVQPIFNRRCIACHGCLGSPCNLKLDSFRGADRGAFGLNPYSVHFDAYPRTEMDLVPTTADWRKRGFYPVLQRSGSAQDRLSQSVLYRIVAAGMQHNQPGFSREALAPLYRKRYDHQCPASTEALDVYLKANPAAGMPFGMPALSQQDFQTLESWVAAGAPGPSEKQLQKAAEVADPGAVARWEAFFNDPDPRSQLVSRFIFDHVFLASIALKESPGDLFRLIRSKTPPTRTVKGDDGIEREVPVPPEIIPTGLPYDNPYTYAGVDRFWYRLEKITTPIAQKNHFVWRLDDSHIAHLRELFLKPEWDPAGQLDPPWGIGNPFQVFRAIPAESRARFLLENSQVVASGVIYGPVCLGQTATYAVKDQFWVYFLDPRYDVSVKDPDLGLKTWDTFMAHSPIGDAEYEQAYGNALAKLTPAGFPIEAIWKGDGKDPNAWLTVLRHETNVSILHGRQGGFPRTQWLMSYSGFERLYYDTVASFKYWEGDAPKLSTLAFFNYLRQENEDNFLLLLPAVERRPIRALWSQGLAGAIGRAVVPFAGADQPTAVQTDPQNPLVSLEARIQEHLGEAISGPPDHLNPMEKPQVSLDAPIPDYDQWEKAVSTLTATTAYRFPRFLPSVILLKLDHGSHSRVYSLIANRAYKTQFDLLFQNGEELPDDDTMSVYPTVIGGFPNLFLEMSLKNAPEFLRGLRDAQTRDDWNRLRERFAVARNSAGFWATYDWLNAWNVQHRHDDAGWLDLSYYDLDDAIY